MKQVVNKKVNLNLDGVKGHVFMIMGTFHHHAKMEGWTDDEIKLVMDEAYGKDINHLLGTLRMHCETKLPEKKVNKTILLDKEKFMEDPDFHLTLFQIKARQQNWTKEEIEIVVMELKGKDYDYIIDVLNLYYEFI